MLLCPLSAPFRSDRVLLGVSLTACKAGDWTEMFSFNYKVNLKRSVLFDNKSLRWKFLPPRERYLPVFSDAFCFNDDSLDAHKLQFCEIIGAVIQKASFAII